MYTFNDLIQTAISNQASDLHISAGNKPCCRINGDIKEMFEERLTPEDTQRMAEEIMKEQHWATLNEFGQVDFSRYRDDIGRFRVNVFKQRNTIAIVARILNSEIPSTSHLGIPPQIVEMVKKRRGLILVTGPTGVGKTTSLASLINVINQRYQRHIITLEDPIEYVHRHAKSIVNQREIGTDSLDFSSALRSALRQDPDVIMIGEMRDLDTISTAITAAETGHLVMSSLHTNDAATTIDRIIDVFPPYQQQQIRTQLADVLECIVAQCLMPKADGRGMVAAMEILLVNTAVKNTIRENKIHQIPTIIQTSKRFGMQSMDDSILELYRRGLITKETALTFARDPQSFQTKV